MAKLKKLLEESFSVVGGVVTTPVINNHESNTSLTKIIEDTYGEQNDKITAKDVKEAISQFTKFGKILQREENLKQVAETLSDIATKAKSYTLSETEDWFDKVTVNRNMKELTNLSKQFGKIAQESNSLQQRLSGLYEDMGHVLGRYFEIDDSEENPQADQEEDMVKAKLTAPKGIQEGDYEEFFKKAMKKFGISSPDELEDDKKKEFFNYVDKNYQAKNEDANSDVDARRVKNLRSQLSRVRMQIKRAENDPGASGAMGGGIGSAGSRLASLERKRDNLKAQIKKLTELNEDDSTDNRIKQLQRQIQQTQRSIDRMENDPATARKTGSLEAKKRSLRAQIRKLRGN